MSGVFGVVGRLDRGDPAHILKSIGQAASHTPGDQIEFYCSPMCGLGRVSPGLLNPEPQPIWSADRAACIVMEGELYNTRPEWRKLEERGYSPRLRNDAELMLLMYQAYGDDFAAPLNGSFAAAIWEPQAERLILVTDRLGSCRLYYAQVGDHLVFAPNVHALLADPGVKRELDLLAVGQFLMLDHMLDDYTLLAGVKLAPPSSTLVYSGGRLTTQAYWHLRYPKVNELRDEEETIEEFLAVLGQALARQTANDHGRRAGYFLSGGIDSRALLAVANSGQPAGRPLTLTWGQPNCDDARYAKEVADQLGLPNQFLALDPCDLPKIAEKGVRITDGGNVVHYHALAVLDRAIRHVDVVYKGVVGDAIMGTALTRLFWARYSPEVAAAMHLKAHRDRGVLLFLPEQLPQAMGRGVGKQVSQEVIATYAHAMQAADTDDVSDQRIHFDMRQRVPRMTLNGVELVRSRAIARMPYCDNDFMDFAFHVPPGLRYQRYVMEKALVSAFPDLAKIPLTGTNLPLRPTARDVKIRAERVAAWHLHRLRLRQTSEIARRPYADHDQWFRTHLRTWVEDILLSPRTLGRELFEPGFVRDLVTAHMAGANHAVRLGALIALELWQRQFLD